MTMLDAFMNKEDHMIETTGNIWHRYKLGAYVIVPTNGKLDGNGDAVMGAGVARVVKDMFPDFPKVLGQHIKKHGNVPGIFYEYHLITLPTKHHWKDKSSLRLIDKSCEAIVDNIQILKSIDVVMPRVGCGLGELDWETQVKPTIREHFSGFPKFIIVNSEVRFPK